MLTPPPDFKRYFTAQNRTFMATAYATDTRWEYYASDVGSGEQYGPCLSHRALVEEILKRGVSRC